MINFDLAEKEGVYGTAREHTLPNFANLLKWVVHFVRMEKLRSISDRKLMGICKGK